MFSLVCLCGTEMCAQQRYVSAAEMCVRYRDACAPQRCHARAGKRFAGSVTNISRALKRALRRDNEYYCLMNIKKIKVCCWMVGDG